MGLAIFVLLALSVASTLNPIVHGDEQEQKDKTIKVDCTAAWPKLELYLPMTIRPEDGNENVKLRNEEWYNIFLRNFMLFWPVRKSQTSIRLNIDKELENDTQIAPLLKKYVYDYIDVHSKALGADWPRVTWTFNEKNDAYPTGYFRQQYLMFVADKHTSDDAEYVGLMDTDALIHSIVELEDLFENGKPVIHGRRQKWKKVGTDQDKRHWADATLKFMGLQEPFTCMSFFPIIIKKSHLADMRAHIMMHTGEYDFEKTYRDQLGDLQRYSQFGMICTYLWHKKQDEYVFYVHDGTPWWTGDPGDNSYELPRGQIGPIGDILGNNNTFHANKPRIAQHAGGRSFPTRTVLNSYLTETNKKALCFTKNYTSTYKVLLNNNPAEISSSQISSSQIFSGENSSILEFTTTNAKSFLEEHPLSGKADDVSAKVLSELDCSQFTQDCSGPEDDGCFDFNKDIFRFEDMDYTVSYLLQKVMVDMAHRRHERLEQCDPHTSIFL